MDSLTDARWIKSSYSGTNGGACVEVARSLPGVVAVRDSKDRDGGVLMLGPEAFAALTAGIRAGDFDLT
jgi:Domain of unknown function (DUF397)